MPTISIVIPCYNAQMYIENCVDSLLVQSFYDFEMIFVDDGSSDNSLLQLEQYTKKDNRIKVLGKQNGGVSSARNLGIENAIGDYIMFVDIDDTIPIQALSIMKSLIQTSPDMIMAGYRVIRNGKELNNLPESYSRVLTACDLAKELFAPSDYTYQGYICSKLYKREIIENYHIRFDERIMYNEDRLFTFEFLSHARKGVYTTEPVYNYIQHGDNAMAAINGPNFWKFETDLDAFIKMNQIAPAFKSLEIVHLVRLGTIASYNWNRRLNKKYGGNCKETNKRLTQKLNSVISKFFQFRLKIAILKGTVVSIFHKVLK